MTSFLFKTNNSIFPYSRFISCPLFNSTFPKVSLTTYMPTLISPKAKGSPTYVSKILLPPQNNYICDHVKRYASSDQDIVCPNELRKLRKSKKVVVIDLRSKDETWRTGVIPGSLCIPDNELERALGLSPEAFVNVYCNKKPKQSDHIVFVCRKGNRSYMATQLAKKIGYNKSTSLQGGFLGWFNEERLQREKRENM